MSSQDTYQWTNAANFNPEPVFNLRDFVAQLPATQVAPMPQASTETVTLTLGSSSGGKTVAAGATIDSTISFETSNGDNAGLASCP